MRGEQGRNGARNPLMTCEPKAGFRHAAVTQRRTAVDFAEQMKWLVTEAYPGAPVVRAAVGNLSTHKIGSLLRAFDGEEAQRTAERLEFHHTPKHGSWLNMAEIELSVFGRQCLRRRIGNETTFRREVSALEHERNQAGATINWRFTSQDARRKFKCGIPSSPAW